MQVCLRCASHEFLEHVGIARLEFRAKPLVVKLRALHGGDPDGGGQGLGASVYLLHMAWLGPALVWVGHWGAGAGAGSVLALAALGASCLALYWAVEEPMRRWGRTRASRWEQADMEQAGLRVGSADKLRP